MDGQIYNFHLSNTLSRNYCKQKKSSTKLFFFLLNHIRYLYFNLNSPKSTIIQGAIHL